MLNLHVDAAAVVRDSLTGRNLADAGLTCVLDGAAWAPLRKPDGYVVFLGLTPGGHTLQLRRPRYADETLEFVVQPGKTALLVVTMKPAADLRCGPNTCVLRLRGGPANTLLWVAAAPKQEIKLAAASAAGEGALRLFLQNETALRLPATLMTVDGETAELCTLLDRCGGMWTLDAPLRFAHRRGTPLWLAQRYRTDAAGACRIVFSGPVQAALLSDGLLQRLDVAEGETEWEIRL